MLLLIGFFVFAVLINVAWLALISDIFSRVLFREDVPLVRAAKCTGTGYALNWLLWFVMAALGWLGPAGLTIDPLWVAFGLIAPVIVFLWEWRSFSRHWSPDLAETFE